MITVEEVLIELFQTVGIQSTEIKFKAIAGSVQHTRTIEIKSFINMIRCLESFNYFSIELEEPIILEDEESPFRINSITILLRKIDGQLRIEKIITDEEEVFSPNGWIERANRRLRRWKPVIDILMLLGKIGLALTSGVSDR